MSKKARIDVYAVKDPQDKKKNIWIVKRAGKGKAIGHPDENGRCTQKKAMEVAKSRAKIIQHSGGKCKIVLHRLNGIKITYGAGEIKCR